MMNLAHAVGKCQNQVPYSCANGMYRQPRTYDWDLWFHPARSASGRKRPPVSEVRSPTLRRRELGALLRARRLELGLTVDQVAERLLCSSSKVSRMETGQRGATQRDVRDLCELYGITDEEERGRLMTLAREGKQQGWWQAFELPYSTYVGLEQEAHSIKIYQSAVVPGLLQTGDYVRAIHEAWVPKFDPQVIEQRIVERTKRQQLLIRDDAPQIDIILDEAVLHRPIGGAATMKEQLGTVLEICERSNVTVQVVPFEVGAHPALESDFVILKFGGQTPSIVYVEGLMGRIYLDRAQDVQRYLQVFEHLRVVALSPKDSTDLVTKFHEVYNNG
jgi:transcriptional regulator with XRE-family HTH domain